VGAAKQMFDAVGEKEANLFERAIQVLKVRCVMLGIMDFDGESIDGSRASNAEDNLGSSMTLETSYSLYVLCKLCKIQKGTCRLWGNSQAGQLPCACELIVTIG
jgi:hypothetical protein